MATAIVRKRVLSESEAEVIAQLLERIANGEDPAKALGFKKAGRPRAANKQRKPMANGEIPDDYDIAWIVRQHTDGRTAEEIYRGVGKAFGLEWTSVRNIYSKLKGRLASPPTGSQKPT